ncbi:MAG: Co2+/Mg2+ efflux protein ApaG [Ignavibacteria bacterium]|nr:MAG: Co2+/Mg2+ efflux protein ApaG [Ignavibacteria bacterium]
MLAYTRTTEGLTVTVQSYFLEERSDIIKGNFFFVYFISLRNTGTERVTLRRRHWYIHDSMAPDYEVEGEGVVGEQPEIKPGDTYHYNSFCVLKSFEGSMEGAYTMERADGSTFEADIPQFYLQARMN